MITLLDSRYTEKEKKCIAGIFSYLEQSVCDYCEHSFDCHYDKYHCQYRHIREDLSNVTKIYKK